MWNQRDRAAGIAWAPVQITSLPLSDIGSHGGKFCVIPTAQPWSAISYRPFVLAAQSSCR